MRKHQHSQRPRLRRIDLRRLRARHEGHHGKRGPRVESLHPHREKQQKQGRRPPQLRRPRQGTHHHDRQSRKRRLRQKATHGHQAPDAQAQEVADKEQGTQQHGQEPRPGHGRAGQAQRQAPHTAQHQGEVRGHIQEGPGQGPRPRQKHKRHNGRQPLRGVQDDPDAAHPQRDIRPEPDRQEGRSQVLQAHAEGA